MKHFIFFIVIILAMITSSVCAQTAKQKVAVYVTGNVESGYKKILGSKLTSGITHSDNYVAVERTTDFLAEITKEQDYQMSGAVSDNQIARLGQQFGVRYVLVADISELFESIFISARMIDVQTVQIINSTEISLAASSIEDLFSMAEQIVSEIVEGVRFAKDDVKQLSSGTNAGSLIALSIPEGYHIASANEILEIAEYYQYRGEKLSFPIYADIDIKSNEEIQYFDMYCYDENNKCVDVVRDLAHSYYKYTITATIINDLNRKSTFTTSYINDPHYSHREGITYDNGWRDVWVGYSNKATTPQKITPGYVYVVKNKE